MCERVSVRARAHFEHGCTCRVKKGLERRTRIERENCGWLQGERKREGERARKRKQTNGEYFSRQNIPRVETNSGFSQGIGQGSA